jgi:stringent starvation protein B
MQNDDELISTKPYLLRAIHEWCSDNGLTPYITVAVDSSVRVPLEYVKDHEIVLNVGYDATTALSMGNDCLAFKARFGGVVRDILVPVDRVAAIFSRENGQGMAFAVGASSAVPVAPSPGGGLRGVPKMAVVQGVAASTDTVDEDPTPPSAGGRPALRRVK